MQWKVSSLTGCGCESTTQQGVMSQTDSFIDQLINRKEAIKPNYTSAHRLQRNSSVDVLIARRLGSVYWFGLTLVSSSARFHFLDISFPDLDRVLGTVCSAPL